MGFSTPRFLVYLISFLLLSESALANEKPITLAVANSTCVAIKEVASHFEQVGGTAADFICKSSGRLAKGLKGQAITADIYISASKKWMDFMLANEMVRQDDVISPWGNKLVVATPSTSGIELTSWNRLTSDEVSKILIGDPGTAPFGRYAKQALKNTGLWEKVKHKIETKKNITLLANSLTEADSSTVGILFVSNTQDSHRIVFRVEGSWHEPIRYYAAPLKGAASNPQVTEMMKFLQSDKAMGIFTNSGFVTY